MNRPTGGHVRLVMLEQNAAGLFSGETSGERGEGEPLKSSPGLSSRDTRGHDIEVLVHLRLLDPRAQEAFSRDREQSLA